MTNTTTTSPLALVPNLLAWQDVHSSFERFCLTAGIGAIEQMLCKDARQLPARRIAAVEAGLAALGEDPGQDRLPRRQGCYTQATGAQLRRP